MTEETTRQELERLEALLDRHGAAFTTWPETDRNWAEGFVARDAEARGLADRARFAEEALNLLSAPRPDGALIGRILDSSPAGNGAAASRPWPFRTVWKPLSGLAFSLVLGIATSVMAQEYSTQTLTTADIVEFATDGSVDSELEDE